MKKFLLLISLLTLHLSLFAQDDPFAALDSGMKQAPEYATATFKGTRLINFQTVETPGKRTLDFRISHRFGDISVGMPNFYGLDGPASVWLGLDYSFDGRFVVSLGRTSVDKTVTTGLKYKLLRQTIHSNKMPVTVTLLADWNIITLPATLAQTDQYKYTTDRFNFIYQVMIARKFNERLSLQVSPSLIHFNEVINITDKNDIFAVPVLARYKFSRSVALTAEYGVRLNKYAANFNDYQNVMGVGFDIETGGHVFQVFVTNAVGGMLETQTIPFTQKPAGKQPFCLGFNISRMFSL